jgi:hypothetical protein
MKKLLLTAALAAAMNVAVAVEESRVNKAAFALQSVAEVSPKLIVHASAFLPWESSMRPDTVRARVESWNGIEVTGLRHENPAEDRRGGYITKPVAAGDQEKMEKVLQTYMADLEERGHNLDQVRIVGVDMKGEAERLLKLSKDEGIMVEVGSEGNFPPAPNFTKPEPAANEKPGCEGLTGPCASPFSE